MSNGNVYPHPQEAKSAFAAEDEATLARTKTSDAKSATVRGGRYLDRLTSEQRKQHPMYSGLKAYFPDALALVSLVSWVGNEKHNPGEPLHHARGKSMDQQDCIERHAATADSIEEVYIPSTQETIRIPHRAYIAWRALADLQIWMEGSMGLDIAPGAWEA